LNDDFLDDVTNKEIKKQTELIEKQKLKLEEQEKLIQSLENITFFRKNRG
tara:strand:- start:321 stop:470 length:150 start_codon:yes stop_codon:yes gene_type:complete